MENTQADYNSLRKLHESTNIAVERLQAENTKLKVENALLLAKLVNCQRALDINEEIMRNALTEQNRIQAIYGQEIQELKVKIKNFEG